jgi:hypothetical protein
MRQFPHRAAACLLFEQLSLAAGLRFESRPLLIASNDKHAVCLFRTYEWGHFNAEVDIECRGRMITFLLRIRQVSI